jgi:nucleotide-binding universal stress UspA family protein
VTGGGQARQPLLDQAAEQLQAPAKVALTLRALEGNAQAAILAAARTQQYDLVIFGRLHQPIGRLLPGPRSKVIAQRLEPSVMRVQGRAQPIRRILLASGGDFHTFDDASLAARIARPLGASVTILHVLSQQTVLFEGMPGRRVTVDSFLAGSTPEANTLRDATALLERQGIATTLKGRLGPVLDEITDELNEGDYDLLVIGAHRVASALDRILLEDITGDLLAISPLPVLVVKGDRSG